MSPLRYRRRPHKDNVPPQPKPFPSTATFLGLALVLIVLWLLAGGLPYLLGWPEPSPSTEAGATK
jgi:hypothetical protein